MSPIKFLANSCMKNVITIWQIVWNRYYFRMWFQNFISNLDSSFSSPMGIIVLPHPAWGIQAELGCYSDQNWLRDLCQPLPAFVYQKYRMKIWNIKNLLLQHLCDPFSLKFITSKSMYLSQCSNLHLVIYCFSKNNNGYGKYSMS